MTLDQAMLLALKLAMKGSGYVNPNPRVGAVLLRGDEIVSTGWHKEYGAAHAEVDAICNAEIEDFSDTTLVVNLEPCSHYGKTPPCVNLILEKKIKRVVIGMLDPNPEVNGKGVQILRDAGLEVITDVCKKECEWVNRFFTKYILTGVPYIILKVAQSLNGCIATSNGKSKWITGEESRKKVHQLRSEVDAVIVGKRTASFDDPKLTVRDVEGRNPIRIIFDTNLSLPLSLSNFIDNERSKTVVCCKKEVASIRKAETLRVAGVKVVPCEVSQNGLIDINYSVSELAYKFNLSSILVEGGAKIFSSFLESDLVDELQLFTAPIIIGNGINAFGEMTTHSLEEANHFSLVNATKSGNDYHFIMKRDTKI